MTHQTKQMRRDAAKLREIERACRSDRAQAEIARSRRGESGRELDRLEPRDESLIARLTQREVVAAMEFPKPKPLFDMFCGVGVVNRQLDCVLDENHGGPCVTDGDIEDQALMARDYEGWSAT